MSTDIREWFAQLEQRAKQIAFVASADRDHVADDVVTANALAYRDGGNRMLELADLLDEEVRRRAAAAKMSGDAIVSLLVRVSTELGRAPNKRPFYYPSRAEWVLEWDDRSTGIDGEAFLQLDGQDLEDFVRQEINVVLSAPARDLEQR